MEKFHFQTRRNTKEICLVDLAYQLIVAKILKARERYKRGDEQGGL